MSKTYRAVLVGTGSIADAHLRAVESTEGRVELVAAVDLDQERLNTFCKRAQVPQAFTDFGEMLTSVGPDLVLIATPPSSHATMSIAAMEAGAWVLCEKPLCGSLAELDCIREAEQRTGCYTGCVFQMRFASSHIHLKRLVSAGQLGRPLVGVCNTLWYRDAAYYGVPWRGRWATELGGPTMGLGIHAMDHFLDLFGEWEEVRAMAGTLDRDIEVEDVSMALVRFANGAFGSIVNSALSPRQDTYIRLDFQKATVELNHLYGYTRDNWKVTLAPPRPRRFFAPSVAKFSARCRLHSRRPAQRLHCQHGTRRVPAHLRSGGAPHPRTPHRDLQIRVHRSTRDARLHRRWGPVLPTPQWRRRL